MNEPELLPCPFCGMRPPQDLIDTLYPTGTYWRAAPEIGRTYFGRDDATDGDGECYGMHCTQNMGGCGASIHGDSAEDAIAAWNRRALPAPK